MKRVLLAAFRMNPSSYTFVAGLVVSIPANLVTSIAMDDSRNYHMAFYIIASILLILAAMLWSVLSWRLDSIIRVTLLSAPSFVVADDAWEALILAHLASLSSLLIAASLFTIIGMVVMFL